MVYTFVKKIVTFVLNKVMIINRNVDKFITLSEKADKTFTYIIKTLLK
jgi:hypothetical protein